MRILAIDSSGLVASAAVMDDDTLLGEYTINFKKTHSQTLLPMIDSLMNMLGIGPETIDAIAVSKGPGSFTGLRIGSATAKGIGLALNKPLVEVPTVDALACNLYDTKGLVVPMMDARRSQVYTGIYCFEEHRLQVVRQQMAVSVDTLADLLNEEGKPVILLGDGVPGKDRAVLCTPAGIPAETAGGERKRGLRHRRGSDRKILGPSSALGLRKK